MRVTVVNRFPKHETYAARVCEGLAELGVEVRYLGPTPIEGTPSRRIRVVYPPWRGPLPPLRSWLLDFLDRRHWKLDEADVVVDLHFERTMWALPRAARRVRVIHRTSSFRGRWSWMRRQRLRRCARRGDRFVVHTPAARSFLASFANVEHVPLVGPAVAPRPSHPVASPLRLLFVGDDRLEKGLDLLVEAARQEGLDVTRCGGLELPLTVEQLAAAYWSCDVLVCPYLDEYVDTGAGSLVAAEALSYAVPVVATPACRMFFPEEYSGVEYAEAATAAAIAAALRCLDPVALDNAARHAAPEVAMPPAKYAAALVHLSRQTQPRTLA